ncbi:lipid II:glycine glycyltransferase FemX [Desulfurivibrio sp. D14AmB]|uniref:lipid II:glycine glycyltransferase FemX n=1 Tax=Desulfurivibrio sp. D14AmB TaxID=3374370 RepID=UPI00376EBC45
MNKIDYACNDQEWDAFLQACPYGHHEQSAGYAANRGTYGFLCDRLVIREHNRVSGGVQILVQQTPVGKLAQVWRGPIAIDDDPLMLGKVVNALEELAGTRGYRSIRVDLFPYQRSAQEALLAAGFVESEAWAGGSIRESALVPLHYSDEELLSRMNRNVRYSVKRAAKQGVIVMPGDAASLNDFCAMHEATAKQQQFPVFPHEYFSHIWDLFGTVGKAQHFIAYYRDQPVAAIFNPIIANTMTYGWGGMAWDPELKKLRVNYLLQMTAIAWAREKGLALYDLLGPQTFKQQFALDMVRYPLPLRKFYGPARTLRARLFAWSDQNSLGRRLVQRASCKLGLSPNLPW